MHIEMSKAFKRKFDASSGREIEPNYGKDKKVSTGYLMSSYSKLANKINIRSYLSWQVKVGGGGGGGGGR